MRSDQRAGLRGYKARDVSIVCGHIRLTLGLVGDFIVLAAAVTNPARKLIVAARNCLKVEVAGIVGKLLAGSNLTNQIRRGVGEVSGAAGDVADIVFAAGTCYGGGEVVGSPAGGVGNILTKQAVRAVLNDDVRFDFIGVE